MLEGVERDRLRTYRKQRSVRKKLKGQKDMKKRDEMGKCLANVVPKVASESFQRQVSEVKVQASASTAEGWFF